MGMRQELHGTGHPSEPLHAGSLTRTMVIGACPVTTDCIVAMSYCENNNMVYSFPNLEKACIMTWRIGRGSNEGAQKSSYNLIP